MTNFSIKKIVDFYLFDVYFSLPYKHYNYKLNKFIIKISEVYTMKATGIVRRIDDLGRVVIPKEIRRTMRIREGDPLQITLAQQDRFGFAMLELHKRFKM